VANTFQKGYYCPAADLRIWLTQFRSPLESPVGLQPTVLNTSLIRTPSCQNDTYPANGSPMYRYRNSTIAIGLFLSALGSAPG